MPRLKQEHTLSFCCYVHTNTILLWHFNVVLSHSTPLHNLFNWVKVPPLKREEALLSIILTKAEKLEKQNISKPKSPSHPLNQAVDLDWQILSINANITFVLARTASNKNPNWK